jgi:hypothetical protein
MARHPLRNNLRAIIAHRAYADNPPAAQRENWPVAGKPCWWHETAAMKTPTQITLDPELRRRALTRAAELGISLAEYIERLVARDLNAQRRDADISALFDLVNEGPRTNIARDKDKMVGEAVWKEHSRKTTSTRR